MRQGLNSYVYRRKKPEIKSDSEHAVRTSEVEKKSAEGQMKLGMEHASTISPSHTAPDDICGFFPIISTFATSTHNNHQASSDDIGVSLLGWYRAATLFKSKVTRSSLEQFFIQTVLGADNVQSSENCNIKNNHDRNRDTRRVQRGTPVDKGVLGYLMTRSQFEVEGASFLRKEERAGDPEAAETSQEELVAHCLARHEGGLLILYRQAIVLSQKSKSSSQRSPSTMQSEQPPLSEGCVSEVGWRELLKRHDVSPVLVPPASVSKSFAVAATRPIISRHAARSPTKRSSSSTRTHKKEKTKRYSLGFLHFCEAIVAIAALIPPAFIRPRGDDECKEEENSAVVESAPSVATITTLSTSRLVRHLSFLFSWIAAGDLLPIESQRAAASAHETAKNSHLYNGSSELFPNAVILSIGWHPPPPTGWSDSSKESPKEIDIDETRKNTNIPLRKQAAKNDDTISASTTGSEPVAAASASEKVHVDCSITSSAQETTKEEAPLSAQNEIIVGAMKGQQDDVFIKQTKDVESPSDTVFTSSQISQPEASHNHPQPPPTFTRWRRQDVLIVMRHGERADAVGTNDPQPDPSLTEGGRQKAQQCGRDTILSGLAALLPRQGPSHIIASIAASPFTRCVETAEAVAEGMSEGATKYEVPLLWTVTPTGLLEPPSPADAVEELMRKSRSLDGDDMNKQAETQVSFPPLLNTPAVSVAPAWCEMFGPHTVKGMSAGDEEALRADVSDQNHDTSEHPLASVVSRCRRRGSEGTVQGNDLSYRLPIWGESRQDAYRRFCGELSLAAVSIAADADECTAAVLKQLLHAKQLSCSSEAVEEGLLLKVNIVVTHGDALSAALSVPFPGRTVYNTDYLCRLAFIKSDPEVYIMSSRPSHVPDHGRNNAELVMRQSLSALNVKAPALKTQFQLCLEGGGLTDGVLWMEDEAPFRRDSRLFSTTEYQNEMSLNGETKIHIPSSAGPLQLPQLPELSELRQRGSKTK